MNDVTEQRINYIGLLAVLIIFSALIIQIFLFGHILGPIFFTLVATFLATQFRYQQLSQKNLIFQLTIFVVTANMFYLWLSQFGLIKHWFKDPTYLNVAQVFLSVFLGITLSFPLRHNINTIQFTIYMIATLFISIESTAELMWAAIGINIFTILFIVHSRKLSKDLNYSFSVLLFLIVSNVIFNALPYVEGPGITFLYKISSRSNNALIQVVLIHLLRLSIALLAGISIALLAKFIIIKPVKGENDNTRSHNTNFWFRYVPFFVSLIISITVISTGVFIILKISKQKYQYINLKQPIALYSDRNKNFKIMTIPPNRKLKILRKLDNKIQVLTQLGIRGWIENKKRISDNKTNPSDNKTNPSDNKTNLSDNKTNPSDNKTNPSDNKTNPSDNKTNPSDNKTNPSDNKIKSMY